jgi:uncharacterized protein (DUF2237 family)
MRDGGQSQGNVLGGPLAIRGLDPRTGFYRTGCCDTGPDDHGMHGVCIQVTDAFLASSRSVGNDLSTPHPEFGVPDLTAGDRWCLRAARWTQALDAGAAPRVIPRATNEATVLVVSLDDLKAHALDLS